MPKSTALKATKARDTSRTEIGRLAREIVELGRQSTELENGVLAAHREIRETDNAPPPEGLPDLKYAAALRARDEMEAAKALVEDQIDALFEQISFLEPECMEDIASLFYVFYRSDLNIFLSNYVASRWDEVRDDDAAAWLVNQCRAEMARDATSPTSIELRDYRNAERRLHRIGKAIERGLHRLAPSPLRERLAYPGDDNSSMACDVETAVAKAREFVARESCTGQGRDAHV